MKKGFTLVEVLAVIVIIGLIFLIAFPTLLNSIKKSQEKIDSNTIELLTSSAKDYANDNIDELEDSFCVNITKLISEGYIDEDIVTTNGNKLLNKSINFSNGNYNIVDDCDE